MIDAVVYTSNTGYTKQYAELLSNRLSLPVYSLKDASSELKDGSEIIYLGWVMAGKVMGCAKAMKCYKTAAVCGVCMGATGSQLDDMRKATPLPASIPLFSLQGGFDMKKLHGVYKFMMSVMAKTVGKKLQEKKDRTPDEDSMLDMMLNSGNYVSEKNLDAVLDWYSSYSGKGE